MNIRETNNYCPIQWIEIYPVDSAIYLLNNWGLVDYGKGLCSSAYELKQNSNASSKEEYIPLILTVS